MVFETSTLSVLDNRSDVEVRLALSDYDGDSLSALQFSVVNRVGHLRFEAARLGDSLAASGSWYFSHYIRRGALQPDLGATDTLTVIMFGLNGTAITPGSIPDLVRISFAVSDISLATDSTSLRIENAVGSLRNGSDAMLLGGSDLALSIMNTVQKGDVDGNDEVDINDVLGLIQAILGRETLTGSTFTRADIAPWPSGDEVLNVRDLVLTQRVILDGLYPDGTPLRFAPRHGGTTDASAPSAAPDVRMVVYVHADGLSLHMTNNPRVKGIQLELNNMPVVPDTVRLRTIFDPGPTWNRTSSNVLVLLMNNDAALSVPPGSQYVTHLRFPIPSPFQVNIKKLIVADEKNQKITNLEVAIVYSQPSEVTAALVPGELKIGSIHPNPSTGASTLSYALRSTAAAELAVYNTRGTRVRTLARGMIAAGDHMAVWDGRDEQGATLPNGVYWCVLQAAGNRVLRAVTLLR
ncbi:MAG: hypothetical protein HY962_09755 [Ignavibacteriae bacterium]|nr:hypothetical protein [Ignavibacteriota bacterium]